ncbi:MAG: heavy metal translocating P-type ATPase [Clostridia bacterium]|nr:heavy metal translocating P-type ATPase [Clostridia bacterium]
MRKFNVTGMSCAACSARVEKAVSGLEGVTSCSVSLLTNSMGVEGDIPDEKIIAAVKSAGYDACAVGVGENNGAETGKDEENTLIDKETPRLLRRLVLSLCTLLPLMYISMGHLMWGFPLPSMLSENPLAIGLCELVLTAIVIVINRKFFINGVRGVIHGAPNMDTLISLGSGVSFIWSVYVLVDIAIKQLGGDILSAHHELHGLYFESAAMILTLITVGKMLEAMSKGRTTNALRSLIDLSPKTATVIVDGVERVVAAKDIKIGDVFVVRPGESVAVDGEVVEGASAIDEAMLTGESLPADKNVGDKVFAGTVNRSGFVKCKALRVGEDTTLSQIIKIVSDAAATKAPIARLADKVSAIFVPTVIGIAIVTFIAWLIGGEGVGYALERAISVLVISCPCSLGLATPVAIMVGSGVGAKRGILFKTAESLEMVGRAQIVVLDKTGTVTKGEMTVAAVECAEGVSENYLLSCALALEEKSEHPVAEAIVDFCRQKELATTHIEKFAAVSGKGVEAILDGKLLRGGKLNFIKDIADIDDNYVKEAENLSSEGKTPTFFALDGRFLGLIAVADTIKDDSCAAVRTMKAMGLRVVMLTGDNERTARAIARKAEIDEVVSGVLPDGKAEVIEKLKRDGKTIMVGDGINDAPALAVADMGIAIGAGTDVAIEAADVVLTNSTLSDLASAIKLSRATLRNIKENLFWAFIYNIIGIPLAAGLFIPIFNWELAPMFGALAMSLSSFCVVMNALRLNFVRLGKPSHPTSSGTLKKAEPAKAQPVCNDVLDVPDIKKSDERENKDMTKTMTIDGMMCPHCSGRVKKCLEALDAVTAAEVSHESGKAILTLTAEIDNETLKKTVEDQGYTVLGIE